MLIIDDDAFNVEILEMMVKDEGYSCDSALSGSEAIEMVLNRLEQVYHGQAQMYKLILLDFSMPGMNGPETAMALREIVENCIALTKDD